MQLHLKATGNTALSFRTNISIIMQHLQVWENYCNIVQYKVCPLWNMRHCATFVSITSTQLSNRTRNNRQTLCFFT